MTFAFVDASASVGVCDGVTLTSQSAPQLQTLSLDEMTVAICHYHILIKYFILILQQSEAPPPPCKSDST